MATESESEPNNHALSRATERFLHRAQTILDDPIFMAKLKQARKDWNRDYPAYKIGPLDPRIPNRAAVKEGDIPLPRRLATAVQLWQGEEGEQGPGTTIQAPALQPPFDAVTDWHFRVHALAHEGWPAHTYPNWKGHAALHPARQFVAACLIWDPQLVRPEEWIESIPYATLVQSIPFDPTIPMAIPDVFRWKTAFERLAALLIVRSDEGTPLTREESAELIEHARQWGNEMGRAAETWAATSNPEGFRFVRLHPGMNTADWRELETIFAQAQRDTYQGNPLRDQARRLHAEGMSKAQIARDLGKHRRTIADWLKNPDREDAGSCSGIRMRIPEQTRSLERGTQDAIKQEDRPSLVGRVAVLLRL